MIFKERECRYNKNIIKDTLSFNTPLTTIKYYKPPGLSIMLPITFNFKNATTVHK